MQAVMVRQRTRARRRRALKQAGMTLIEIMIVVVIIGMVTGGIGLAAMNRLNDAKVKLTEAAVRKVRSAINAEMALSGRYECMNMDELVKAGSIDGSAKTTDEWGTDFRIECDGMDVAVSSAGPDQEFGTEDDISVGLQEEVGEA